MHRLTYLGAALAALALPPAATPAAAQGYATDVRVWVDDDREVLRLNERVRARVQVEDDAYVAVFHITTDGDVEVLYPSSPHDDGYLRGGRTYDVGERGSRYVRVRDGYGIGYVFAVASPRPLDLNQVRPLWSLASYDANWNVTGDPYWHVERITRLIVPEWEHGEHDVDVYNYHVGRRYTSPRYACYDSYGPWYHYRGYTWNTCDRVRVVLIERPYYYDTRYYGGYHRRYYDPYYVRVARGVTRTPPVRHGYKEETSVPRVDRDGGPPRRPSAGGGTSATPPSRASDLGGSIQQERGRPQQEGGRVTPPSRERPTLERRPSSEGSETRRESPPARREEPRRESPPPREETRRESPPARREEPRRESPPARRESPPARSQPSRESSPPRSSSPSSRPSGGSAPRARPS